VRIPLPFTPSLVELGEYEESPTLAYEPHDIRPLA